MAENIPERPRRAKPTPVSVVEIPPAPDHLSAEAAGMWREINDEWVLGPDSLPLLRAALESWDLYQRCRREVMKDGPTVSTGNGMVRQHPAAKVAGDALREFRMCFRQLGLEPPK